MCTLKRIIDVIFQETLADFFVTFKALCKSVMGAATPSS